MISPISSPPSQQFLPSMQEPILSGDNIGAISKAVNESLRDTLISFAKDCARAISQQKDKSFITPDGTVVPAINFDCINTLNDYNKNALANGIFDAIAKQLIMLLKDEGYKLLHKLEMSMTNLNNSTLANNSNMGNNCDVYTWFSDYMQEYPNIQNVIRKSIQCKFNVTDVLSCISTTLNSNIDSKIVSINNKSSAPTVKVVNSQQASNMLDQCLSLKNTSNAIVLDVVRQLGITIKIESRQSLPTIPQLSTSGVTSAPIPQPPPPTPIQGLQATARADEKMVSSECLNVSICPNNNGVYNVSSSIVPQTKNVEHFQIKNKTTYCNVINVLFISLIVFIIILTMYAYLYQK